MKTEAQRIAIAEECGYSTFITTKTGNLLGMVNGEQDQIPDYPNDLNAMRDAESTLNMGRRRQCVMALRYVIVGSWPSKLDLEWQMKQAERGGPEAGMYDHEFCAIMLHATAVQRCEAFLRTIGKWAE